MGLTLHNSPESVLATAPIEGAVSNGHLPEDTSALLHSFLLRDRQGVHRRFHWPRRKIQRIYEQHELLLSRALENGDDHPPFLSKRDRAVLASARRQPWLVPPCDAAAEVGSCPRSRVKLARRHPATHVRRHHEEFCDEVDEGCALARNSLVRLPSVRDRDQDQDQASLSLPPPLERQEAFRDVRTTKVPRSSGRDAADDEELYRLGVLYDHDDEVHGAGFSLRAIARDEALYPRWSIKPARRRRERAKRDTGPGGRGGSRGLYEELELVLSFSALGDDDALAAFLISPDEGEATSEMKDVSDDQHSTADMLPPPLTTIYEHERGDAAGADWLCLDTIYQKKEHSDTSQTELEFFFNPPDSKPEGFKHVDHDVVSGGGEEDCWIIASIDMDVDMIYDEAIPISVGGDREDDTESATANDPNAWIMLD